MYHAIRRYGNYFFKGEVRLGLKLLARTHCLVLEISNLGE